MTKLDEAATAAKRKLPVSEAAVKAANTKLNSAKAAAVAAKKILKPLKQNMKPLKPPQLLLKMNSKSPIACTHAMIQPLGMLKRILMNVLNS